MKKIYILSKKDRNKFLKENYMFNGHRIDVEKKNVIENLINYLEQYVDTKPLVVLSEGVRGYFTFFATNYISNVISVIINPIFFSKTGLVTPPYNYLVDIENNKTKKIVILSKDNKLTEKTIKLLDEWDIRYRIIDGSYVSNEQLSEILIKMGVKPIKKEKEKLGDFFDISDDEKEKIVIALKHSAKITTTSRQSGYGKYYGRIPKR